MDTIVVFSPAPGPTTGGSISRTHEELSLSTTGFTADASGIVTQTGKTISTSGEVFICLTYSLSNATSVSGAALFGDALTQVGTEFTGNGFANSWWRGATTSTSGSLTITTDAAEFTSAFFELKVAMWRVDNAGATASVLQSGTGYAGSGTTSTVSQNVGVGDLVLAFGRHNHTAALDIAVSGVTEDADDDGVTAAAQGFSCGSFIALSAETPRAITYTSASEIFSQNAYSCVVEPA